jgi:hypothetical protein
MVMEMKFIINKYSQVFYRVGPGYRELTKFLIVKYFGFPREVYNFRFTDVEFHTVSNAPTLYRVVRLIIMIIIIIIIIIYYCYSVVINLRP